MTGSGLDWLDLRVADDPHPRRFSSEASLRAYLLKVERLSADAVMDLLAHGELSPPAVRREYRVDRLAPAPRTP